MRHFYVIIAILILSGCAARVISSGPNGVAIDPVMIYPDMAKIQALADAECAKYGRIAIMEHGRSSSKVNPVVSLNLVAPEDVQPNKSSMLSSPIFGFKCVNRPVAPPPSPLEWPQLQ
jgi:hypothetical protein